MGMEQQYQEQRRGSSMCLVCGRQGGNTIVVTNVHSFVSASGTPLSDFLVKVVGEDPCYSVSEVICQQCFVLLDRLDAYQARAAEIHSHLTSRYRDTKLELLGQRKRMSELIASSLSNVQELRHGTTLNVSDELTITVVHEAVPKKGRNIYGLENGSLFGHLKVKPESRYNEVKEDAFSRLISQKLKKRKVPQSNSDMGFSSNKRRKLLMQNSVPTSNNNNNISYAKSMKNQMYKSQMYIDSVNRAARREPPHLVDEVKDNSDEDEYASDGDDDSVSDADGSRDSVDEVPETEKEKEEEDDNDQEEESSDESSSDSDDDGSGGEVEEEDDDDDKESEPTKEEKGDEADNAEEEEEEDDEEDEDGERLSDAEDDEGDAHSQRPESSLSQKSKETVAESTPVRVKEEVKVKEEPIEDQSPVKYDNTNQLQLPSGVAVPPQVAEAMLMQSPLATSLLQSFLATSLWFGSPETPNKKVSNQSKLKQEQQVPDDVTREMLAFAAGSTKDKKKRQELKNTGQSYINTKGKLVNAKRVWPQDCSRCPLKCNARISEEERQKIFAEYWGLADYNLQREYLAAHMQREEKLGPSGLLRTVILYFLTQGKDKKLQVCRQFFLKTLDVSEKASRIVLEKMVRGELGSDSGATSPLGIIRPLSAQGETQESAKENDTSNISIDECEVKSEGSS
ncbi:neurofilament medium polypeptide-like [Palaemon carinicauda]|uniref:neurofilament medium polypeptide-like n=1 Tax=Palaemon carinicauda TaxID=392227 RepID=UPI0035B594E5